MNKLVKNELIKIFSKKSIYITLAIVLGFVILTNCIYKFSSKIDFFEMDEEYIKYIKEEIATLDPNNPNDVNMYISLKTDLDVYEMKNKYEKDSWQRIVIENNVYETIYEKNMSSYGEEKNLIKAKEIEKKINELIAKLDTDDWKYFASEELTEKQENLKKLQEQEKNTQDKKELETLKLQIDNAKVDEQVAKYRIEKDIKYGDDYMNIALEQYRNASKSIIQIDSSNEQLKYEEKKEYNDSIKQRETSRYVLENRVDIEKIDDLREILKDLFNEFGIFILVMVVMISGIIVSEEFSKGTIKLLLIKPYTRNKILLAKFITTLIMIAFSILVVIGMELIVGGILFGFDSLSVPVVEYNFNTQALQEINIFTYLGIKVLTSIPGLVILSTLAFTISTLFTNSAIAIIITMIGYMSGNIINMLVAEYNIKFMKYFITMNWDLDQYLFGNLPSMEGMTMKFSIIVCVIYFIAMISLAFINFKKKNIKNI